MIQSWEENQDSHRGCYFSVQYCDEYCLNESTDHEHQLSAIGWKTVYNFVVIIDDLVENWNQYGKDAFVNSMLGID